MIKPYRFITGKRMPSVSEWNRNGRWLRLYVPITVTQDFFIIYAISWAYVSFVPLGSGGGTRANLSKGDTRRQRKTGSSHCLRERDRKKEMLFSLSVNSNAVSSMITVFLSWAFSEDRKKSSAWRMRNNSTKWHTFLFYSFFRVGREKKKPLLVVWKYRPKTHFWDAQMGKERP